MINEQDPAFRLLLHTHPQTEPRSIYWDTIYDVVSRSQIPLAGIYVSREMDSSGSTICCVCVRAPSIPGMNIYGSVQRQAKQSKERELS